MRFLTLPLVLSLLLLAAPASAQVGITFDELVPADDDCCFLTEEYADLGVHFVTTDDGSIWGGNDNGNPGDWRINGTNGPAFLGFNGPSHQLTANFDEPVVGFTIDFARAYGGGGAAEFRIWGSRNGDVVEKYVIPLQGVNVWQSVTVASEIDSVRWRVLGDQSFRPYGVDNLSWEVVAPPEPEPEPEPELLEVDIDVKPFSRGNRVYVPSRGFLPVVIFGTDLFAVEDLDPTTLALGPEMAPVLDRWFGPHMFDVNRDGLFDMLAFFPTGETGLQLGDTELCLVGVTLDGDFVQGCDGVDVVERIQRWGRFGGHHGHDDDDDHDGHHH